MHVSYFKKANQSKKYKVSLVITPLENPRDGGAWWATVYGVAQSRTRLKPLSSSSSRDNLWTFCWASWWSVQKRKQSWSHSSYWLMYFPNNISACKFFCTINNNAGLVLLIFPSPVKEKWHSFSIILSTHIWCEPPRVFLCRYYTV